MAILAVVAILGVTMAARWVPVQRNFAKPGRSLAGRRAVPPERNFPVPVVIAHGLLGLTTIVLVVYSTLGS